MDYPVDYQTFKASFPELITAAQAIGSSAFNAESKFDQALKEYRAMRGETLVVNAFCPPNVATAEQIEDATYANSLGLAALFAGYVRQMNVQNEFVPGYDGEDAGNNEANLQGLANTMFNAQFAQNSYGRKYLNIIYRGGVPLGLVAM